MAVGVLSVSGKGVRCEEVVAFMRTHGICGDVTAHMSIVDGEEEPGCRIRVVSSPIREQTRFVWEGLKARWGLGCAHVHMAMGTESGCVLDVYRPV